MKAIVLKEAGKPVTFEEYPNPEPVVGERIVRIWAAALNRRDYWITVGKYPGINPPVVLGSDGAGMSEGEAVVINPGLYWGDRQEVQGSQFEVLGLPRDGCFAEFVRVPEANVFPKPNHLSWEEAAALPLAGITAYRALFVQGDARPGQKLLITGIGGGVAMMVMLFALSAGLEVYVTSSDESKLAVAKERGVAGYANYTSKDWQKEILPKGEYFDLIIDSAGGKPFAGLLKLCKPAGKIIVYGGTLGKVDGLSLQVLFWRQQKIIGSTMGSPQDFRDMLDFVIDHKVTPLIHSVHPLKSARDAIESMAESDQLGKIVLRVDQ